MPSVGRSLPRREDRPLLQGRGRFVDDIDFDGTLHARFVRSSVAHALLLGVDSEEARAVTGVVTVVDAAELALPPLLPPIHNPDALPVPRPLLATGKIRFAGEAVAVVVADSPYVAEDAAELVAIDLEALPAVTTTVQALRDDAPRVHDQPTNVMYDKRFSTGDELPRGPVVIHRTFSSSRQTALPMEPRGLVARPDGDGLEIWASTQSPHMLARAIAAGLGLAEDQVRVIVPDVGGGFGLKAHAYPEELVVAALARRLGRPVKWVEDRAENLTSSCHARGQTIDVTISADADGVLTSIDADVVVDMGAYGVYAHGHLLEAGGTPSMIPGPYRLRDYRFRSRAVTTTKVPLGAYRGVGLPVATFVHERAMDLVAAETGVDRAEVRRRNLLRADELPYTSVTGQRYDSGDYGAALDTALREIRYSAFAEEQAEALRAGRLLGLGFAVYVEYSAVGSSVFAGRGMLGLAGYDEANIVLGPDGLVRVWTTLPTAGQGITTTFAQLTADELGVDVELVEVRPVDTAVGRLRGNGTFASRSAVSGGGAIRVSCEELRRRLLEDAGDVLEASPADLEIVSDAVRVRGAGTSSVRLVDLAAAAAPDRYDVVRRHDPEHPVYPYGAHACRVEVDPVSGFVRILDYVVVEDCGRIINPRIALGQTHGAVAQGIAGALYEELSYDEHGQLQTASLMDYLVPTASEVPPVQVEHMHVPTSASLVGAKGVGESGTLAPGATLANAVADALGAECNSTPLRPTAISDLARARLARKPEGVR